jgi:uncharacterized protein YecT (DUF1311 family)
MIGRRGLRFAVALVLSATIVLPGMAQDISCNADGNTHEMAACAREEFSKADQALNAAYQALLAELREADRSDGLAGEDTREKRLRAAQRAWLAWRDSECNLRAVENFGGSLEVIMFPGCQAELTRERAMILKSLIAGR